MMNRKAYSIIVTRRIAIFVAVLLTCSEPLVAQPGPSDPTLPDSQIFVVVDLSGSMKQILEAAKSWLQQCHGYVGGETKVYGFHEFRPENDERRKEFKWHSFTAIDALQMPRVRLDYTYSPLGQGLDQGLKILKKEYSSGTAELWFVTDEIYDQGTDSDSPDELIGQFRNTLGEDADFPWVCYFQFRQEVVKRSGRREEVPYRLYIGMYYDKAHMTDREHREAVERFLGRVDELSVHLNQQAVLFKFDYPPQTVLFNTSQIPPWIGRASRPLVPFWGFSLVYQPRSFRLLEGMLSLNENPHLYVSGFSERTTVGQNHYQVKLTTIFPKRRETLSRPGESIALRNIAFGRPIRAEMEWLNLPTLNAGWREFFSIQSKGNIIGEVELHPSAVTFNPLEGRYSNIDTENTFTGERLRQTTQHKPIRVGLECIVRYPQWFWWGRIGLVLSLMTLVVVILAIVQSRKPKNPTRGRGPKNPSNPPKTRRQSASQKKTPNGGYKHQFKA